jgi:hypothetical protein
VLRLACWGVPLILTAVACGGSEKSESLLPARCETPRDVATDIPAGTCKFARAPINAAGTEEVLNALSERLTAPPGGLWWLAERLTGPIVAESNTLGAVELETTENPDRAHRIFTTLRVPANLPVGTRLRLGCRELVVGPPLPALNIREVVLTYAYRPELGGTGFIARMPPALRSRVYVESAYVGLAYANVLTGIHVLDGLLFADAPSLCNVAATSDAPEFFVPLWGGEVIGEDSQALAVFWHDADDFANFSWSRLCSSPVSYTNCPFSTDQPVP